MTQGDESFLKRLLATFKVEAEEHLAAMSSLLLELEREPGKELVEALFREAHSLKGAARAVNLGDIEQVCQALERVLASLKKQGLMPPATLLEALDRTVDGLVQMLAGAVRPGEPTPAQPSQASDLIRTLEMLSIQGSADSSATRPAPAREPAAAIADAEVPSATLTSPTVRISTTRLEALLVQTEELLAFKFGADHLADELSALNSTVAEWRRNSAKRTRHLRLMRRAAGQPRATPPAALLRGQSGRLLVQWLDAAERDELLVRSLGDRFAQLERTATRERRALSSMVDKLHDEMKQALMLPFASLLELAPKLVRDLARDCGKEVELVMHGAALEIDRRILEQMKTPLIHLLRNAVDHGIEAPAERQRCGKPRRGRIAIEVAPREGNKVEMTVVDDGGGIDLDEVKGKALKMGLLSPLALSELPAAQALGLVFESGLSTSPILTDLSGHGLGLAIAREKVDKLDGTMTLEAQPGEGTRFSVVLPTALATFRGLLVALGERQFVLPSRSVERVARVKEAAIRTVENREAIELDGQALSLVRLRDVLGLAQVAARARAEGAYLPVVVLANSDKRIAFAVDEILGDQEVLVKPLRAPLKRVRHVAGATILGAGRVVPLLDVGDLMKSALKAGAPRAVASQAAAAAEAPRPSLLVVENSITSRALLKGILESAGYLVSTAVDGIDALTMLHSRHFDLAVSDVEMPRLDGFDLTARIRADKQLAELPVVLVTALGSREDKERGIEVGANAYIVKSGFDQGNLLEVIRSLL